MDAGADEVAEFAVDEAAQFRHGVGGEVAGGEQAVDGRDGAEGYERGQEPFLAYVTCGLAQCKSSSNNGICTRVGYKRFLTP